PGRRLAASRTRLVEASTRLESASRELVRLTTGRIATLAGRLDALSPLGVLARGYAVCWNTDRTAVIRDADAVAVGDEISITLQRGRLRAKTTGRD
ncbi:MAG: exodeoxyribonuclease VII large subunit, partial [Acidobacteria bacterium]|nr:exodeoxyribonuclease VII large subunit [Acidobacteriota bacterium]